MTWCTNSEASVSFTSKASSYGTMGDNWVDNAVLGIDKRITTAYNYSAFFGSAILNIGDLNGDSVTDIAVGSERDAGPPNLGGWYGGAFFIFFMQSDGGILSQTKFDSTVTAGSVTTYDIGVDSYFGSSLELLGDFNNDGIPDIVVGEEGRRKLGSSYSVGGFHIIYLTSDGGVSAWDTVDADTGGWPEAADSAWLLGEQHSYFGHALLNIGDVDADGVVDLIVSDPEDYFLGYRYGTIYLIFLQTDSVHPGTVVKNAFNLARANSTFVNPADFSTIVASPQRYLGRSLARYNDYNLDGRVDFLVADYPGNVYLMGLDGAGQVSLIKHALLYPTSQSLSSIAAYDFDDDLVLDVIMGLTYGKSSGGESAEGVVQFMLMNSDFSVKVCLPRILGVGLVGNPFDFGAPHFYFGSSMSLLGDFDNDGYDDVAIGGTAYRSEYGDGGFFIFPLFPPCPCVAGGRRGWECDASGICGGGIRESDTCDPVICNCTGTPFIGDTCQTPCLNGGLSQSSTACDCTGTGFIGSTCNSECLNGGISAGSACDCTGTGYVGNTCKKNCNNGVPNADSTLCNCSVAGATGAYCQKDIDDCESSPCAHNGVCSDLGTELFPYHNNEFNCSCNGTGYHGPTCDISDCASSPCLHNAICETTLFGLFCNCSNTGYEGDSCQNEIDECVSSPCLNNGYCTDLQADFICDCTGTGYEGTVCFDDVDDCASSPCQNSGVCKDKGVNTFQCTCDSFWQGSTCSDNVDDCLLTVNECLNGGGCTDDPVNLGDVICDCSTADSFTGKYCNVPIEDACVTFNPCLHGGKCIVDDVTNEMSCDCRDTGYEGDDCDVQVFVSECVSSPCLNGGQCYDPSNQQDNWYCVCTTAYSGDICDFRICDSMPCHNGGICISDDDAYTCTCLENYSGAQCQVNEDEQAQAGSSSSSADHDPSQSEQVQDASADSANNNSSDSDATVLSTVIIVLIVLCIATAVAAFFYKKQQNNSVKTFVMPT